ncbi:hypothetical protein [Thermogemmatispora sp.]|uniref:hypothetical protein n=1 Tax=Thermogemmatispora sp. TaxID=1968838 RepID=UPI0035E4245E
MADLASVPDFEMVASCIAERFERMRPLMSQWADLARLAVQGLPHDRARLAELERRLNQLRAELRTFVLVASEHFSDGELTALRKRACMSKSAWRSLKKVRPITTRSGFTLISF